MQSDSSQEHERGHSVRDLLEEAILSGEFQPGERLEEQPLALRFGVSRTPIREALKQLETAGLVEVLSRRGAAVAALSPDRLIEMFEFMAEIEAFAGRLATRRLTPEDHTSLVETHEACRAAVEQGTDAYYYANERFHHAIYKASRSRFLLEQATNLHRRLKPYRRLQLRTRNRVFVSFGEHEQIVSAILAGKEQEAGDCLRSHVLVQGERFSDLIASMNWPAPGR